MPKGNQTNSGSQPLGHIEHVIVLMFENRSFDNVLGALYPGRPGFDGIPPGFYNPVVLDGQSYKIPAWTETDGNIARVMPYPDPHEHYEDMKAQIDGGKMTGFAQNYASALHKHHAPVTYDNVKQIMQYYSHSGSADYMPITSMLAQHYAVSDQYFASGPVQTWPNRLFAHCGTPGSHGTTAYLNNDEYPGYPLIDGFLSWKTVFQQLDEASQDPSKKTWKVYYDDELPISAVLKYVHDHYNKVEPGGNVCDFESEIYTDFFDDLAAGNLPRYSFIEPRYQAVSAEGLVHPNSNHPGSAFAWGGKPPISVAPGELMLQKVFKALQAQPEIFKKTLFIVTYDEHGGLFDHIKPPPAVSPFSTKMTNYNYDQYGVRVPALFINPYIKAGTVFRPPEGKYFDHTSIIATLRDQFSLNESLTPRVHSAPVFSGLINSSVSELNFGPEDMPDMTEFLPEEITAERNPPEQFPDWAHGTVAYSIYYSAFLAKDEKQ